MKMFEKLNVNMLTTAYEEFKKSEDYQFRKKQTRFIEIAQLIIVELLKKTALSNNDLTALIQMFGYRCKRENFLKYLKSIHLSKDKEDYIYNQYIQINEMGYTGRGRSAITGLTNDQLAEVKKMLDAVATAKDYIQVRQDISHYDDLRIPQVTSGVYSPWLYYLKPSICPLVAGTVTEFLNTLGWDGNYITAMDLFKEIAEVIGEKDLGFIDAFFWNEGWKKIVVTKQNDREGKVTEADTVNILLKAKKQIILYGPPGTGKTYNTKEIATTIIVE